MNETCSLCKCFNEIYFFYLLLVAFLAILIAVPVASVVHVACRSKLNQNAKRIKRLLRLLLRKCKSHLIPTSRGLEIIEPKLTNPPPCPRISPGLPPPGMAADKCIS